MIVSFIGTFNYDLALFLCDLLSPVIPDDYSYKDTFSFVSQNKNANLSCKFLVSYNIPSLFINIPLQETIDLALNLIFNHNPNKKNPFFFVFATSQTNFLFNGKFYNQIDGVAMFSLLAHVLANLFMSFSKSKRLNECNFNKTNFI